MIGEGREGEGNRRGEGGQGREKGGEGEERGNGRDGRWKRGIVHKDERRKARTKKGQLRKILVGKVGGGEETERKTRMGEE